MPPITKSLIFFFLQHTHSEMIIRANHRETIKMLMEKAAVLSSLCLKFLLGTNLQFDFILIENDIPRWYTYPFCLNYRLNRTQISHVYNCTHPN